MINAFLSATLNVQILTMVFALGVKKKDIGVTTNNGLSHIEYIWGGSSFYDYRIALRSTKWSDTVANIALICVTK